MRFVAHCRAPQEIALVRNPSVRPLLTDICTENWINLIRAFMKHEFQ